MGDTRLKKVRRAQLKLQIVKVGRWASKVIVKGNAKSTTKSTAKRITKSSAKSSQYSEISMISPWIGRSA